MTEFAHTNHCGITYEPTEHGERVTITADDGCHVIVGDRAVPMVEIHVIDEAGILWVESTATRTWWRWTI